MPQLLLANKNPKQTIIGEGEHRYEVQHGFAQLPDKYTWQTTHNVAVDAEGLLYVISFKAVATASRCAPRARNSSFMCALTKT